MKSHPDRRASTLAGVAAAAAQQGDGPFAPPGAGARDCRIDLKLLQWRALRACERSAAARQRLATFAPGERPDLWAGTVPDGVARGFAVALEEAVALAGEPSVAREPDLAADPVRTQVFAGKELRKKKDLLVGSAGARVRFSRKEGVLFVDRAGGLHSANCVRFEARVDRGTLDAFVPDEQERPRLFSAQFLQPQRYVTTPGYSQLVLAGRIGRTREGWDCTAELSARDDESAVRLALRIDNRHDDRRLRVRFLGIPADALHHECTDVREVVQGPAGGFVAFTLLRAVGRLDVDGQVLAVPAAQCHGVIEHVFWLGGDPAAPAKS